MSEKISSLTKSKNFHLLTTTAILGVAFFPYGAKAEEENQSRQLPTVTVIDSRESYNSSESSNYKFTEPLLDTPKTVTTVTRQLMDDQGVTTMRDALRNVPGISIAAGEAGAQGDSLTIRGFTARSDFFIDGMRDFGSYYRDPFNLDSVEVVQGPSSVLFGRGSTGGVIAQNSKQAFLGSQQSGSIVLGTNDTTRATADVNAQIPGIKGSAFRLNAMAHRSNFAGRDYVENERSGFAPTLAFGLGTDTRFNINYLHQQENDIPDYGLPWLLGKPAPVNRSNFYGFKSNDFLKTNADITTAKFEHDFSQDYSLRNQFRYAHYTRNFQGTEPIASTSLTSTQSANLSTTPLDQIFVNRNMLVAQSVETYLGDQMDLTSKFDTFTMKHKMVTGVAVEHETSSPLRISYKTGSTFNDPSTSLLNPNAGDPFTGASSTSSSTVGKIDTLSAYAMDTIKFNDKWELLLGLRFDHLQSQFFQTVPTPVQLSRIDNLFNYNEGLVYKPKENGSIYANYGTSFNPSAENFSLISGTTSIANLKPEKNTIYEVGTKWDLFKKRLSTAFAIFRMEKQNARETVGNTVLLSGDQVVNGFQSQISGSITEIWKITAGYTYLDGKVTKSLINPTFVNRSLQNVPEHSFNLFTTYKLLPKLEVGGGMNFVSKRYASTTLVDPGNGLPRKAPGYVTFNAMAKYPLNKNITMQLNVNNLLNAKYDDQLHPNHVVPGERRVILLTTNVKF